MTKKPIEKKDDPLFIKYEQPKWLKDATKEDIKKLKEEMAEVKDYMDSINQDLAELSKQLARLLSK